MRIIDPRTDFATPEQFPDVPVAAEKLNAVLPRRGLDRYTALTHDPKIDEPALTVTITKAVERLLTYSKLIARLSDKEHSAVRRGGQENNQFAAEATRASGVVSELIRGKVGSGEPV
jgi:hypothetical protein